MTSNPSKRRQIELARTFAGVTALMAATAFGCSDDTGTDIEVDGTSGSAGSSSSSGKPNAAGSASAGKGGKTSNGDGGAENRGGDGSGGDGEGVGGVSSAGSGGTQGGGGAAAGTSGAAGTGGGGAGGAAGSSGAAGTAGIGGTAGTAGSGGTAGTGGTAPVTVCGDSVEEGAEECEPDSTPLCSDSCEAVSTQACFDCENAGDCFEFFDNCNAFTGANKTLCYDVMQCLQDSNCDDGTGTLGKCFCGSVPAASCGSAPLSGAGAPDGVCKELIVAGLVPVATSAQVLGLLTATSRPAGGAMARLNCQKMAKTDPAQTVGACYDVCGFGSTDPFPP